MVQERLHLTRSCRRRNPPYRADFEVSKTPVHSGLTPLASRTLRTSTASTRTRVCSSGVTSTSPTSRALPEATGWCGWTVQPPCPVTSSISPISTSCQAGRTTRISGMSATTSTRSLVTCRTVIPRTRTKKRTRAARSEGMSVVLGLLIQIDQKRGRRKRAVEQLVCWQPSRLLPVGRESLVGDEYKGLQ